MSVFGAYIKFVFAVLLLLSIITPWLPAANACDDEEEHDYGDFLYDVPLSEQDRSSHVDPDEIEPYSNDDLLDRLKEIDNLDLM